MLFCSYQCAVQHSVTKKSEDFLKQECHIALCLLFKVFLPVYFRTVKFWDLESFQLVSSIDPETNGIR